MTVLIKFTETHFYYLYKAYCPIIPGNCTCASVSLLTYKISISYRYRDILPISYRYRQWQFWEKIFGGPGPSSFGRQPRLSEITIEPISGVLPKFRWVYTIYARNVAPSSEHLTLKARGLRHREAWGSWGSWEGLYPSPAD